MARYNTSSSTNTITGAATISSPFQGAFTEFTGTAPYTVTLPAPAAFPGVNQTFYNATGGVVTVSTPSGAFTGTGGPNASTFIVNSGNVLTVVPDGTNYIVISEDGSPLVATTGSFSSDVAITGGITTLTPSGFSLTPSGSSGSINNVSIGATTRSTGAFTTLAANQAVVFTANTSSSSSTTGTLVVTGGMGVSGNINSGATVTGVNLAGTISTAAQTNITSVGALTSLAVDTNTIYVDSTNHRLGVGTSTPSGRLHLYQSAGGSNILTLDTNFSNGNAYAINPFITGISNGGFSIRDVTNSVDRLVIQYSTGNVGIGTTAPGATVEIYKSLASTTTAQQMLIINTDYASGIGTGFGGAIVFRGRTAGNALQDNAQILGYNEDANDNGYALGFFTRPTVAAGLQQRMTILRYGNVGIGTTTPQTKLDVAGNIISRGDLFFGTKPSNTLTTVNNNSDWHHIGYAGDANYHITGSVQGDMTIGAIPGRGIIFGTATNTSDAVPVQRARIAADGGFSISNSLSVGTSASVGTSLSVSEQIRTTGNPSRSHFYSFSQGTMNGGYVHLKTNAFQTSFQMYSVLFSGHDYSGAKSIFCTLGWYNYAPSNGPINIGGNAGTHPVSAYKSSDGYTVMVMGPTGGYYTAFTLTQFYTTQGLADLTISAAASSSSSTGVY